MSLIQTQKKSVNAIASSTTITFTNPTITGNFIVLTYGGDSNTGNSHITSITDNYGNTYRTVSENGTGATYAVMWYAENIIGGSGHIITLNIEAGAVGENVSLIVSEYSDIVFANSNYAASGNNGSINPVNSNNAAGTSQEKNLLVIGMVCTNSNGQGFTAGSGYGNLVTETSSVNINSATENQVIAPAIVPNAGFTLTITPTAWAAISGVFKILPHAGRVNSFNRKVSSGRQASINRQLQRTMNSSLLFNGTTSCVDMQNPGVFNPTTGLTIALWVLPLNNNCRLINKDATSLRSYILAISSANLMEFDFFSATVLKQNLGGFVTPGRWQHLAATYDGATMINYINGVNVKQTSISGTIDVKATNLFFGKSPTSGLFFKGYARDFFIKGSALTPAQIKNLMLKSSYTATDGFFPGNETAGTILSDISGNNNHGVETAIVYDPTVPVAPRASRNTMAYIFDSFAGANNRPINGHIPQIGSGSYVQTASTSFFIQGNKLEANRKTDGDLAIIDCAYSDINISANLISYSNGTDVGAPGLVFRYVDSSNYWYAYIDSKNNFVDVYNVVSGVSNLMINHQKTIVSGNKYNIKLKCYKKNITLWVDGFEIVTVISAVGQTATKVGFRYGKIAAGNRAVYSDFVVENFNGLVLDWPVFTEYASNPVIPLGANGTWDDTDINNPNVIWDPNNNVWQLYYSGYDGAGDNTQDMGLASATNLLGPWTKNASNPVMIADATDSIYAFNGGLIFWNGLWYNYYCSNSATKIRVATSPDLINWTKVQLALDIGSAGTWDSGGVFDGFARIRANGTTIELWYAAKDSGNTKRGIGYATSTDGLNFTKSIYNPFIVTPSWANQFGNLGEPSVYVPTGQEGIQALVSFDSSITSGKRFISQAITLDGGLTWHYRVGALLKGTGWEANQVFDSFIMVNNGTMYLYHSGANIDGGALNLNIQIGVATATPVSLSTLVITP